MGSLRKRRPSPAFVVAMLALLVALGGTATALPGKFRIDGNDLRPRVVKPYTIQRNAVRPYQLAPNTVGHFWLRPNTIAARAYARVNGSGTVDDGFPSFGIHSANISHPSPGIYCLSGLGFTPRFAMAIVDAQSGDRDEVAQTALTATAGCPASTQVTVTVEDAETNNPSGVPENARHSVMVY